MHSYYFAPVSAIVKRCLLAFTFTTLAACGLAMSNEDRLDRAEQAIDDGEYRAAIIDAKDALRKEPDNVRGRLLLGKASVAVNDGAAAEKEFRKAIELGTPLADVVVGLAKSLLQQRRYQQLIEDLTIDLAMSDEDVADLSQLHADAYLGLGESGLARELYESLLSTEPENIAAKLGIVSSYVAERNIVQARATMDEVLTSHWDSIDAWLQSGELNIQLNGFENAEGNFVRALQLIEEQGASALEARALVGLAEVLLALKKVDDARGIVDRLLELAPESTSALQLTARIAYVDEDWTTAQQNLQLVLQRVPDYRPAQMLLGVVHLRSGNLAQAEMYLSNVVAASPGNVEARTMLAETRLQMDRLDQARETLMPIISGSDADPYALSIAARVGMGSGDFESGIAFLQQGVQAQPDNIELQLQLAAAYIAAGQIDNARGVLSSLESGTTDEDKYRRDLLEVMAKFYDGNVENALVEANALLDRSPRKSEVHNLMGHMYLSMENFGEARRNFEAGLADSPGSLVSQRYLASIDVAEGKFESAHGRYTAILKSQPSSTWAMISLARIAARNERPDEARKWLEAARTADSKGVEARAMLVGLYLSRKQYQDAETVAAEAVSLDGRNASLRNALGLALLNQGRLDDAITSFRHAVDLDENNSQFRLNLAKAQRGLDDAVGARQTLEQVQDLSLSHTPSAGMLIALKIEENDFVGAMQIAKALQNRHPDEPAPIAFEGEVHLAAGNHAAAVEAYDRALAIRLTRNLALRAFKINEQLSTEDKYRPLRAYLAERPLDTTARLILAQSYQRNQAIDDAVREYERVIEGQPDNSVALNNLAWLYHEINDARAEDLARRAYQLRPSSASIADTLGWILIQQGAIEEGVRIVREAIKNGGDRAELRYHLAAGLAKLGQKEEARRSLEDILNDEKDFTSRPQAEDLLKQL